MRQAPLRRRRGHAFAAAACCAPCGARDRKQRVQQEPEAAQVARAAHEQAERAAREDGHAAEAVGDVAQVDAVGRGAQEARVGDAGLEIGGVEADVHRVELGRDQADDEARDQQLWCGWAGGWRGGVQLGGWGGWRVAGGWRAEARGCCWALCWRARCGPPPLPHLPGHQYGEEHPANHGCCALPCPGAGLWRALSGAAQRRSRGAQGTQLPPRGARRPLAGAAGSRGCVPIRFNRLFKSVAIGCSRMLQTWGEGRGSRRSSVCTVTVMSAERALSFVSWASKISGRAAPQASLFPPPAARRGSWPAQLRPRRIGRWGNGQAKLDHSSPVPPSRSYRAACQCARQTRACDAATAGCCACGALGRSGTFWHATGSWVAPAGCVRAQQQRCVARVALYTTGRRATEGGRGVPNGSSCRAGAAASTPAQRLGREGGGQQAKLHSIWQQRCGAREPERTRALSCASGGPGHRRPRGG